MSALHTLYAWITWIAFVLGVRYLVGASKILLGLRLLIPVLFAWPVKRIALALLTRAARRLASLTEVYERDEDPASDGVAEQRRFVSGLEQQAKVASRGIAWVVFVFVHDGLRCPACMGFWTGVAFYPMLPIALPSPWASAFLSGLCGMILSTWVRSLHARRHDGEEESACRVASAIGLNNGCEEYEPTDFARERGDYAEEHVRVPHAPEETDDETTPQEASDRSDG